MLVTAVVDWTQVLVVGIPAYIGAILGGVAAIFAARNHFNLKTPSGDSIGHVTERTHDLAAVSVKSLHKLNGGASEPPHARAADA